MYVSKKRNLDVRVSQNAHFFEENQENISVRSLPEFQEKSPIMFAVLGEAQFGFWQKR